MTRVVVVVVVDTCGHCRFAPWCRGVRVGEELSISMDCIERIDVQDLEDFKQTQLLEINPFDTIHKRIPWLRNGPCFGVGKLVCWFVVVVLLLCVVCRGLRVEEEPAILVLIDMDCVEWMTVQDLADGTKHFYILDSCSFDTIH